MKKGQEAIGLIFGAGIFFILVVLFSFAFLFIPGCKKDSSEQSTITTITSEQYIDLVSTLTNFLESPININNQELKVKDAIKIHYNDENARKQIEELGKTIFDKAYVEFMNKYKLKGYEFKIT